MAVVFCVLEGRSLNEEEKIFISCIHIFDIFADRMQPCRQFDRGGNCYRAGQRL
jgi:hypothetical protein